MHHPEFHQGEITIIMLDYMGGRCPINRLSKGFRGLIAQTGLVVQPLLNYFLGMSWFATSFRFYRGSFRDFDRDNTFINHFFQVYKTLIRKFDFIQIINLRYRR